MLSMRAPKATTFALKVWYSDRSKRPLCRVNRLCQRLRFHSWFASRLSSPQSEEKADDIVLNIGDRRRYSILSDMYGQMETYQPPEWAATLSCIPKKKIRLAMANTPIQEWTVPGVPADFTVSVKRDDLTGCALSGNKIRKLEFLMADALDKGCRHVITCGSTHSNQCRAMTLCARQLGLTPHLLLRSYATDPQEAGCEGNMLLNRLCGAHIYLVPRFSPYDTEVSDCMKRLAQHIQVTSGEDSYIIPLGGSNTVGLFGIFSLFEELRQQGVLEQYDDLVFTCGSGGTAAGLAIANYLTGSHLRVHGIIMGFDSAYSYKHVDEDLQMLGLGHLRARDLVRLVDGYVGDAMEEELEFIQEVAEKTSILLDHEYNVKGVLGMVTEMKVNPSAFQGRRVLYLHTGGLFGLFDGQIAPVLEKKEERQPLIKMWPTVDDCPL